VSLFSKQSSGLMGVDISASGIKLVELARGKNGYEISAYAYVSLPEGAIVENSIAQPQAVSDALRQAVAVAGTSSRDVALAVSGNAVIIKTITLPVMSELELEGQIEFEADQHVPYDIEDVSLDFFIQGASLDDPEQMDVVLVACKREIIEQYQQVMEEAGLRAACIDCAVFAIENAAEMCQLVPGGTADDAQLPEQGSEATMLVNIGATMMNINVCIAGRMGFVRDQFFGGQHLSEAIAQTQALSMAAAEQLKVEQFDAIQPAALQEFYMGLTSELTRSLDFYNASRGSYPVGSVCLTGGTALLPNIADELTRALDMPVRVINPLEHLHLSATSLDAHYLKRHGPMLMVPLGLALRKFDR